MPGSFCCIVGCSTRGNKEKYPQLTFFRVPSRVKYPEWSDKVVRVINRCDKGFNRENARICSIHFKEECIRKGKNRSLLIEGSIPTEFLPSTTVIRKSSIPRRTLSRIKEDNVIETYVYTSLSDVEQDFKKIVEPWIKLVYNEQSLVLGKVSEDGDILQKVKIEGSLQFKVECLSIPLPDDHELYTEYKGSIEKIRIHKLLKSLDSFTFCSGLDNEEFKHISYIPLKEEKSRISSHFISITHTEPLYNEKSKPPVFYHSSVRSSSCKVLCKQETCRTCVILQSRLKAKVKLQQQRCVNSINKRTPLQSLSKDRLMIAVKKAREQEKKQRLTAQMLKSEIDRQGLKVTPDLHKDLMTIVQSKIGSYHDNSFEKLFWDEQEKNFRVGKKGMRWHPMMIRFALHLHLRSPSAYSVLRESGVLNLPSERTLRDYSNALLPKAGFDYDLLRELKDCASKLNANQKFVVLMHDEMSIKDDLVYDKATGNLIGFINTESIIKNGTFDITESVATQVLVFMIQGINSSLKQTVAYFGTRGASTNNLFPLLWKTIGYLECFVGLKVVAVVSDKASANMRLFQLHAKGEKTTNKAVNLFAKNEERNVYFFSDPPHLIKTARNNLANSGSGLKSRLLWNNGKPLLWSHVVDIFNSDIEREVRLLPKLTKDHIFLNSYSVMNVKLAAQVLSSTVSHVMSTYGKADSSETARFLGLMDKFFDCCNVRSKFEGSSKRKPYLAPYESMDDPRFSFLQNEVIPYFKNWQRMVKEREGEFSAKDKAKMFISPQTFQGIIMTCNSLAEAVKYLLSSGLDYVLTSKFSQDPLEEHFGRHRSLGRRATNPTLYSFGYQENKLRVARSVALTITPKGNTKGKKRIGSKISVSSSPMKKRRTRKKEL